MDERETMMMEAKDMALKLSALYKKVFECVKWGGNLPHSEMELWWEIHIDAMQCVLDVIRDNSPRETDSTESRAAKRASIDASLRRMEILAKAIKKLQNIGQI